MREVQDTACGGCANAITRAVTGIGQLPVGSADMLA